MTPTPTAKLAATLILFAVALALVLIASVVDSVWPLFAAWVPLLSVPWLLARPSPGDPPRVRTGTRRSEPPADGQPEPEPEPS